MKTTVVITAYKAERFLKKCLDSVLQQDTLEPFDVILGIDGCEDTLDYFNYELLEYPVRAIYLPENKGTYITTNTLINMVDEGLILRFDSDDEMLPFMMSDLFDLELGVNDIGNFPCFNFDGNVKKVYTATHGCLAFNKELFNELGGYKPWRCAADTDFLNRARGLGVNLKKNPLPFNNLVIMYQTPELRFFFFLHRLVGILGILKLRLSQNFLWQAKAPSTYCVKPHILLKPVLKKFTTLYFSHSFSNLSKKSFEINRSSARKQR